MATYNNVCKSCGKEFITCFREREGCSPECCLRILNMGGVNYQAVNKHCLTCDGAFAPYSSQQKFCSEKCRKGYVSEDKFAGKRSCRQCGKEFDCNCNAQYYCSRKCRNTRRNIRRRNREI